VIALRQEVARSYQRSEELGQENERLRTLVASLRRELGKSRSENKTLQEHLHALEKRLHEISSPPPSGGGEGPPANEPPAPAPAEPTAASAPPAPPPAAPAPPQTGGNPAPAQGADRAEDAGDD